MVGGVIGGYCATGRLKTATRPARKMTMDSTEAKIGRRMKKWDMAKGVRSQETGVRSHCLLSPVSWLLITGLLLLSSKVPQAAIRVGAGSAEFRARLRRPCARAACR